MDRIPPLCLPRALVLAAALIGGLVCRADLTTELERLKGEIHTLSEAEIRRRLLSMRESQGPPPPRQSKIDHFVVLLMENHAADFVWGCMGLPGFDGIPAEGRELPKDPNDPSKGSVNVSCGGAALVCPHGPDYEFYNTKFAPGAEIDTYPYGEQSDVYSFAHGADGLAIKMFRPDQLPVKHAVAKNFGVFNRLYSAAPTASTPNHLMVQSATSCGLLDNVMYSDKECGGKKDTFPQLTIYDSLFAHNVSFALYMNSTCGLPYPNGTLRPPCHGLPTNTSEAGSPIPSPDVAMEGVGRYKAFYRSQTHFYEAAAAGTLPALSWVLPHEQACDHPCHDNAKGERFLKDIYEALRAGPGWEKTLFLVVYDDPGGYYDHVVPPFEGVPADEAPCRCPKAKFDFRRLGIRTTGALMSPWVGQGAVFQEPKGPTNTSQFDLTSVPATLKNLFNLSTFLTKRDEWSGSFHELLLDTPRQDSPMHLPAAPLPAAPWEPAHNGTWPPISTSSQQADAASPEPRRCSAQTRVCLPMPEVSMKQKKQVRWFSALTHTPEPDLESMTSGEVEAWLAGQWDIFMADESQTYQEDVLAI